MSIPSQREDPSRLEEAVARVKISPGICDVPTALRRAQVALKNRRDLLQIKRVLLLLANPLEHLGEQELAEAARGLRKNNLSLIAFMCLGDQPQELAYQRLAPFQCQEWQNLFFVERSQEQAYLELWQNQVT